MDDSALKALLTGFDAHRLRLEGWLEFWTWLVVIGVACEIVFIVWSHKDEHREWFTARTHGAVPFPSKPSRLRLIFEILSVALVVAGVSGELVIGSRLGKLETSIRDINEKRVLHLQQEAGNAAQSAQKAKDDAQAAHDLAQSASDIAKPAKETADRAKAEADEISVQANQLDQELGSTKLELDTAQTQLLGITSEARSLEQSLAPRRLWVIRYADRTSNIDSLKVYGGTEATIRYIPDFEAERAARVIASALDQSGWKILGVTEFRDLSAEGVNICRYQLEQRKPMKTDEDIKAWQQGIANTTISSEKGAVVDQFLTDNGWDSEPWCIDTEIPPRSVLIKVGYKPNPFFVPEPFKSLRERGKELERKYSTTPRRPTTAPAVERYELGLWFPAKPK
jgi:hypothetical protein